MRILNHAKCTSFLLSSLLTAAMLSVVFNNLRFEVAAIVATPSEIGTVLSIDPIANTANPSPAPYEAQWFTVNFSISNVTNLYSWQINLRWKLGLLLANAANITEGPFLKNAGGPGSTFFVKSVEMSHISIGASLKGAAYPKANGSGVLATASFRVVSSGNCSLELYDTILYGYNASLPPAERLYQIPHSRVNASFYTTFPVADFTMYPDPDQVIGHPVVGETVTFDATSSYDPDQIYRGQNGIGIVSYSWNFGDGSTGMGKIINYTYSRSDHFTVRLDVTDDDGETFFKEKSFLVELRDIVGPYQYCTPDFTKPPVPNYYETSEFMLGSVAVGVIIPESEGPAYNWTDDEIETTIGGIEAGMDWWKTQNPNATLSFVFDIHTRVPTVYEPIQMNEGEDWKWIEDVMSHLNYAFGNAWEQVTQYNNDIRRNFGTDWAFTIFVVDSDPAVNMGNFAGGGCAHAFLGGPWITMSRFSVWAYNFGSYFDAMPAHEMGHIFYATDEYDSIRQFSGYLNASDKDGSFGIMNRNDFYVSASTKLQIGWRDTDQDGILDIMDTHPAIRLDNYPIPIMGYSYQFSGVVVEVPHQNFNPFGQRNNLSINEIISVDYSIDEGSWLLASPSDGAFDEAFESYTLMVTFSTPGIHTLRIRAANSVGNSQEWNYTVENVAPAPVAYFTYWPTVAIPEETTFFDGSGSYDPSGGTIVTYAWDFGDGTTASETDAFTSHVYTKTGNFTVRLTIINNFEQTGITERLIVVKQRSAISVSATPNPVEIGNSVTITGSLSPTRIGTVIVIHWRPYTWESWIFLTSVETNQNSEYSFTWMPQQIGSLEIRVSWSGDETTLPAENFTTLNVIRPPPKIVIEPTSGPVGAKIVVKGYNFISSTSLYLTFDDQLIGIIFVDETGLFNATFSVPLSEVGPHTVKAVTGYYMYTLGVAEATFTVVDVAPLDVNVEVGSIYFKQETAVFYVYTTFKGTAVDVTLLKITLVMPEGTTQTLMAQHVSTGLYMISYVIKDKGSMIGTYTIMVEASYTTETIKAHGSSIKTFLVKPTWEKEAPKIAALSIASIGLISVMAVLWRKEKKKFLP